MALTAVSHCVSSLLGPARTFKCLPADAGHGELTSDSLLVLDRIAASHPAAILLLEACESLHQRHGCGVTALVILVADLAARAVQLCEEGFAMRAVLRSLRAAACSATGTLDRITLTLPSWEALTQAGRRDTPSLCATPSPPPSPPTEADLSIDEDVAWFFAESPIVDPPSSLHLEAPLATERGATGLPLSACLLSDANGTESAEEAMGSAAPRRNQARNLCSSTIVAP